MYHMRITEGLKSVSIKNVVMYCVNTGSITNYLNSNVYHNPFFFDKALLHPYFLAAICEIELLHIFPGPFQLESWMETQFGLLFQHRLHICFLPF